MKSRVAPPLIRAASLALVLAAASACAVPWSSSGPKDFGGTYMILAVKADASAVEQSVAQASEVIRSRCDALWVYCKIERQGGEGSNRLKLRVSPGPQDFARVRSVLLVEGKLELRAVVSKPNPAPMQSYSVREDAELDERPDSDEVLPFEDEGKVTEFLLVEREPVVTGLDIQEAFAASDGKGKHWIDFGLKPEAASRFGEWTDKNVGRYVAIVLDGKVRSAPYIRGRITDHGQIMGSFTGEQAEDVALTLKSGKLPAPIEVIEEGRYTP